MASHCFLLWWERAISEAPIADSGPVTSLSTSWSRTTPTTGEWHSASRRTCVDAPRIRTDASSRSSRYQTKYKRRRSGKTDYYAPKRRLVVRFTNRDIIMQVITSEIAGDKVFCSAYAHELRAYGLKHGLTNWAAAYCTGLLIARRVLKKLGLDEDFKGVEEPDGEFSLTEAAETDDGERRPFKAFLDVGLLRTSTGARVFGAMKGASDGGILVPHNVKRFPGNDIESKELDAETLKKYIFGGHVAEYMESLADDDEERY